MRAALLSRNCFAAVLSSSSASSSPGAGMSLMARCEDVLSGSGCVYFGVCLQDIVMHAACVRHWRRASWRNALAKNCRQQCKEWKKPRRLCREYVHVITTHKPSAKEGSCPAKYIRTALSILMCESMSTYCTHTGSSLFPFIVRFVYMEIDCRPKYDAWLRMCLT